jgi:LPS-assembly lipoprotein
MNRWLPIVLAALMLCGCGFKLRGDFALPPAMDKTYVSVADGLSPLERNLARALAQSGRSVVPDREQAAAVLDVTRNQMIQDVLSVGDQARVREFEMRYEVDFRVVDAAGVELVPPQTIVLRREYRFDEQQFIGITGEEEAIREDLERDMVRALLERIARFKGSAPAS